MVEIKQQLVPLVNRKATYGTGNPKLKMVVHQTGNTTKGANAQVHANLQSRGYSASWHIQSDDKEIIQSWPFEYRLWHASTGNAPNGGNMVGIGWEICINEDGDYLKSLDIAAKGIAKVMKQEGIPMSQLTTHNAEDPKNKWCPAQILSGKDGVNWNDFKAMVQKAYNGQPVNSSKPVDSSKPSAPSVPKPSAPSQPKPELKSVATIAQEVLTGKWGNGDERKRRLEAAGYNYNSVQNEVNKSASAPSQPSKPKLKSVAEIAKEVLAGKWGNGDDRKRRLQTAGYDYNTVQKAVNQGTQSQPSKPKFKSVATVAQEVIDNKWSNGDDRKRRLQAAGYNYQAVQAEVNKRLGANNSNKKSNETIAKEVLAGKWGNGDERKRRLEAAGYNFNAIQSIVNRLA